ncbi:hypothetical protein CALCODRAFT_382625 [Calocera cornea HHB12733]|uniref:Uncharacterized protein n=1 Tax=Calocera cornea HHB12733 TaxID=1353952 RepID=A0A165EBX2_9BASI|nr:hypothetical protein CALCODRAFT_382625 [Calocera cornea HHB12733]
MPTILFFIPYPNSLPRRPTHLLCTLSKCQHYRSMANAGKPDALTPTPNRPAALLSPVTTRPISNTHTRSQLLAHHPSPSLISLSSVFSSTSRSSSSSASSTGVSNEPLTPHSPGSPLPPEILGSSSTSPPRVVLKGPRPRPKVMTNVKGARPVSVMPTIPSEGVAPSRHVRSSSIPDSFQPQPVMERSKGPPQLPQLVLSTSGDGFESMFLPSPGTIMSGVSSISAGALSAFPLPPESDHFSPHKPNSPSDISQSTTPLPQRQPPWAAQGPSISSVPTRPPGPVAHPRTVFLREDGLVPPSPADDAPPHPLPSHTPEPTPQSTDVEVDWGKLDRIMGTWKASQKAKSREVGEILKKGEEDRKRRTIMPQ